MLGLDVTRLVAIWGRAPLKITPTLCLPIRYQKSDCRICVQNCPVKAVEVTENSVSVTDKACTGCGVCASLCPTGVFEMTNLPFHHFFKKAEEYLSQVNAITLECYKVPFGDSLPLSLRVPCLAHITPGLMLKLLSVGAKEIIIRDAGICEVCESKCGDKAAEDTVLKIQELLKDSGFQQKASVITNVVSINNLTFKGDRLKDYKEDYEVSRREMFSVFRKGAYKGVAGVIKEEPSPVIDPGRDRLKKGIPKEREELLKAMEGLISSNVNPQTPLRSRIFPAVKIDKGCDMCKLCHLFCPTDALTIEDTKEGQGIAFKAATCLGCGLCAPVCAKNVLTLKTQEILPDEIIQQKKRIIVWFDKARCADCGRNFVKIKSGEICDTCLKERELQ